MQANIYQLLSTTEANYIKAIYQIIKKNKKGIAKTGEISTFLDIKGGSVTEMLKKLHNKKVLFYGKSKGAQLTADSIKFARHLIWKHKVWERFLTKKLFFTKRLASEIADNLQHIQPKNLSERLEEFLNRKPEIINAQQSLIIPEFSAPSSTKGIKSTICFLSDLPENSTAKVVGYGSVEKAFVAYTTQINLKLGTSIKFIKPIEIIDSIEVIINNDITFHIVNKIAKNVLVKIDK